MKALTWKSAPLEDVTQSESVLTVNSANVKIWYISYAEHPGQDCDKQTLNIPTTDGISKLEIRTQDHIKEAFDDWCEFNRDLFVFDVKIEDGRSCDH